MRRGSRPRPGAGCRRSSRACRRRRGPGSTGARSSRARRPRARRLRRRRAPAARVRRGDRRSRGGRRQQRVLVSVFLDGGADSLSMLFPAGDPLYRKLRPAARAARPAGRRSPRTTACAGTPRSRRSPTLHGEGKVGVLPAIGYDHPNQSHFTSRHFWEVGATSERLAHRLARPLPRPLRLARQPAAGAGARLGPAAVARDGQVPVASIDGPDRFDFWARGVWGERRGRACSRRSARSATLPTPATPRSSRRPARRARPRSCYAQLPPFRPRSDKHGFASPVAYPDGGRRVPAPARRARRDARRRPAAALRRAHRPGATTRTTTRRPRSRGLKLTADSLLAFQRDLEARGLADRVLVHVWSEFGRRAEENGSGGTDHGAAGAGFLIGSRAAGQMVGEFPALAARPRRQPARHVRLPRALRGLLEQWLGGDAEAILPGAAKSPARRCFDDRSRSRCAASLPLPAPARVQVTADEFRLRPLAPSIKAGPAIVQIVNLGEDEHDLRAAPQPSGART